jgi:hypothetical protein
MKRIIVILVLLALTIATLATCAAKPHPPTEKEIAEFHRTHPVGDGAGNADIIGYFDPLSPLMVNRSDVVAEVEIVGNEEQFQIINIGYVPFYKVKVINIIARNPLPVYFEDSIAKKISNLNVEEIVYIRYSVIDTPRFAVGDRYIVIGAINPSSSEYFTDMDVIWTGSASTFYTTTNDYLIALPSMNPKSEKYTGKSEDSLVKTFRSLYPDWEYTDMKITRDSKAEIISLAPDPIADTTEPQPTKEEN